MTTRTFKRLGLALGAVAIAAIVTGIGYQSISAQGPGGPGGSRLGGPGRGFGGPGGGGPMGRRGGPGGPGGGPPGMLAPALIERLDLSSDQRDRVRQILESHRDETASLGERARKAHEALQEAVTGTFDESAIRARAAELAVVDADIAVAQGRVFGEVFQILTSEQQQKLRQLQADMKQRQDRMKERMQERREEFRERRR